MYTANQIPIPIEKSYYNMHFALRLRYFGVVVSNLAVSGRNRVDDFALASSYGQMHGVGPQKWRRDARILPLPAYTEHTCCKNPHTSINCRYLMEVRLSTVIGLFVHIREIYTFVN